MQGRGESDNSSTDNDDVESLIRHRAGHSMSRWEAEGGTTQG
jgi:hypothetical protein